MVAKYVFGFNGVEGCGKSTVIEEVARILRQKGANVKIVAAFSTPIGQVVRPMIKAREFTNQLQEASAKFAGLVDTFSRIIDDKEDCIYLVDRDFVTFALHDIGCMGNRLAGTLIETLRTHNLYTTKLFGVEGSYEKRFKTDISFVIYADKETLIRRTLERNRGDAIESHIGGFHDEYKRLLTDSQWLDIVLNPLTHSLVHVDNPDGGLKETVENVLAYIDTVCK